MKKRFFNIFIVPEDPSRVKKFKLPLLSRRALFSMLGVCFISISFLGYDYARLKFKSYELNTLRRENIEQKLQIQTFTAKMSDMELQMNKLRQFDRKLRIITNLEPTGGQGQYLGMGGPSPMDETLPTTKTAKEGLVKQMHSDLDELKTEANKQEKSFNELHEHLLKQTSILASTPTIWPVRGWVTSGFGFRNSPFTGLKSMHEGLDISNAMGTPVIAPGDGIVLKAERDAAMGKMLLINHGYGVITRYGHLSEIFVGIGKRVKRGEKIAAVGNTGKSTGPHLHYQVEENSVPVSPYKYILD
ncbi:MAG: M23 family metallopeptidase [Deltaproteobacteria bacterium]|nr:M23 family metallopeptidase [Deltaproteobacteria bacterium]